MVRVSLGSGCSNEWKSMQCPGKYRKTVRVYVCVSGSHLKPLATILELLSVSFNLLPLATFCQIKRAHAFTSCAHTHIHTPVHTHARTRLHALYSPTGSPTLQKPSSPVKVLQLLYWFKLEPSECG
ncbi:hypothetical protein XENOCAPTIV_019676 [Xenoophorus captivus]|uniref:Uncharacterized protein n=1 Tax=Xenoophorus captivus TaxID=1517983 RepID=A0ABV0SG96_9TELE